MGGIKYYQLAKGEEPPDEFCAVRDIGGEPSEYTFYAPEAANAKLRELVRDMYKILSALDIDYCGACPQDNVLYPCPRYTIYGGDCKFETAMRELGVEGDG